MGAKPGLLCTVDSGAKAGAALWYQGQLQFCRLVREREIWEWQSQIYNLCLTYQVDVTKTVVETPIVRSNQGTKVDPNKLIKLGVSAGRLVPAFSGTVQTIIPNQWKGTLPDEVLYARIMMALTETEKALIPDLAEGLLHNVLDAIGIGINELGRWPRNVLI